MTPGAMTCTCMETHFCGVSDSDAMLEILAKHVVWSRSSGLTKQLVLDNLSDVLFILDEVGSACVAKRMAWDWLDSLTATVGYRAILAGDRQWSHHGDRWWKNLCTNQNDRWNRGHPKCAGSAWHGMAWPGKCMGFMGWICNNLQYMATWSIW